MLISQTDTLGSLYFLSDAQGSTRALTDGLSGAVTSSYDYDAFGNLDGNALNAETNYLYTGQQFDPYTELYSLRARYYDPSVGRFLSRDTWAYDYVNPFELNRYVYGAGNPVRYTDPSGYMAEQRALRLPSLGAKAAVMSFGEKLAVSFLQGASIFLIGALGVFVADWVFDRYREREWEPPSRELDRDPGDLPLSDSIQRFLDQLLNPHPIDDFDPHDWGQPRPWLPPFRIDPRTRRRDNSNMTVVELGAGDYSNAITNRIAHPEWTEMWATNRHEPDHTIMIEWQDRNKIREGEFGNLINNFYQAQQLWNINVGLTPANPITNEDSRLNNIANLVYVINPYPSQYENMGNAAGRIANSTDSEIYIAGESLNQVQQFQNGVFRAGHICIWRDDSPNRFGRSSYGAIDMSYAKSCRI